jgi:hypothetical protein
MEYKSVEKIKILPTYFILYLFFSTKFFNFYLLFRKKIPIKQQTKSTNGHKSMKYAVWQDCMGRSFCILYPEFLALLAQYLCQRLTVLQESCNMAKFLKYNKLATSVVKMHLNTPINRRCQAFVRPNNR